MFTLLRPFIASSLCLCIAAYSVADTIEEVEVLGERQAAATVIDVNLETYNGFEQIINRSEFENRLVDVGDIVNSSVSAQIRKNSGFGGYSAFSIRGSTGKQVNLYLDGMLITSPQSGYGGLSNIPTSIVEQVEIYPDFTPAQLSDANLGGAINIRTRLPEDAFGGRVATSFGSFNTQQQELDFWGGNEQTEAILALSHAKSDNDYPIDRSVICEDMTCGSSKKRENAAYQNYSALGKVRHQFNQQYSLQVLAGSSKSNNEVPHKNNRTSHDAELDNTLHQFNTLLQSQGESLNWGLRLYGNQQDEYFRDRTGTLIVGGGSKIKQKQTQLGINNFTEYQLASHTLGLTVDYSEAAVKSHNLRMQERWESKRKRFAVALSEQWQATSALSLNAVVRANRIDDTSESPLTGSNGARCKGTNSDCLSNQKTHTSWQTGIAWQKNAWTLKMNIGEMIRVPTLTERFGETGAFLGNADLKPEKSQNIDAGIIFDNDSTAIQLSGFYKQLEDGILVLYDSRGVGHPLNIAKAIVYGAEVMASQKLGRYFSIYLGGQWMESENQAKMPAVQGKKLYGFYHLNNQAGVRFKSTHHQWDLQYQHDDELFHNASNTQKAKARQLLNTSYTWFYKGFSVNFSLNNLLDYRYVDFGFMPAQGRSYTTTLSYNF